MSEQLIGIAAKLYECRNVAKSLFGAEYKARVGEYMDVLKEVAERAKVDVLKVATEMAKDPKLSGVSQMLVFAAAVEILEPSA